MSSKVRRMINDMRHYERINSLLHKMEMLEEGLIHREIINDCRNFILKKMMAISVDCHVAQRNLMKKQKEINEIIRANLVENALTIKMQNDVVRQAASLDIIYFELSHFLDCLDDYKKELNARKIDVRKIPPKQSDEEISEGSLSALFG